MLPNVHAPGEPVLHEAGAGIFSGSAAVLGKGRWPCHCPQGLSWPLSLDSNPVPHLANWGPEKVTAWL